MLTLPTPLTKRQVIFELITFYGSLLPLFVNSHYFLFWGRESAFDLIVIVTDSERTGFSSYR